MSLADHCSCRILDFDFLSSSGHAAPTEGQQVTNGGTHGNEQDFLAQSRFAERDRKARRVRRHEGPSSNAY